MPVVNRESPGSKSEVSTNLPQIWHFARIDHRTQGGLTYYMAYYKWRPGRRDS
jgi:hypothetical protein